ncbi:hypothetical protein Emag_001116 [Eimeria magna]
MESFDAFASRFGGRQTNDIQREAQLSLLYSSYLRKQDPTRILNPNSFAARLLLFDNDLCQPVYAYNGVYGPSSFSGGPLSWGAPHRGGDHYFEGGPHCTSITDIGSSIGVWGFIDAAIRMQTAASFTLGVAAEGPSIEGEGGGPPPKEPLRTTRPTRVARRLEKLLADNPAEALMPPAAPDERAENAAAAGAAAAAAASPGWRLRPDTRHIAATAAPAAPAAPAAAATAPIGSVEDMLLSIKRRHSLCSLLPPLRRCRPEVPSDFCMRKLLEARALQVGKDYAADSKDDESWWEELREKAALYQPHAAAVHTQGLLHAKTSHADVVHACEEGQEGLGLLDITADNKKKEGVSFVNLEDILHADFFDGDPLVEREDTLDAL